MTLLRERVTIVWLALMAGTCVSTWALSALDAGFAVAGVFLIAAVKVRFVMLDFMELRTAPVPVRVAFEAWIVVVTWLILGIWFATPSPF